MSSDTPQTLSSILTSLAQNFGPRIVRQTNRRSMLIKTLPIVPGFGKNVPIDVEVDGMIAESFSDGDEVTNFGSDVMSPGVLSWLPNRANFKVTDLAMAAAASSRTPTDALNLWGRNVVNALTKLASTLNAAFYTQLLLALADDNTYAGMERVSAFPLWRSNVMDPGSATQPSLDQIRGDIMDTIYTAGGEQPDLAFCRPAVFRKLGSLFTDLRRYNQPVGEITTAKGKVLLDASVGAIEFEGCTFVKDKDAPAGSILYINSDHCHIEYLPQTVPEMGEVAQDLELNDGFGAVPLAAKFYILGRTGAYRKATAQNFTQIVVDKPNACGIRKNIDTTSDDDEA